jgi:hypothetical protein
MAGKESVPQRREGRSRVALAYAIHKAVVVFVESAFTGPLKLRSRRGLNGIYELYGRNYAGEYLHIAYRREATQDVVFHIRAMSSREKHRYRNLWRRHE